MLVVIRNGGEEICVMAFSGSISRVIFAYKYLFIITRGSYLMQAFSLLGAGYFGSSYL